MEEKSRSSPQEPRKLTKEDLYRRQMTLLRTFLASGAITKAQYDKSAGDLTCKMGFSHLTEK